MRNLSSYYPAPRSDEQVLKMWLRPSRTKNSSCGSANEENLSPVSEAGDGGNFVEPLQCGWTSSSSTADSYPIDSDPFASRPSIAASLRRADLPEIPFISRAVRINRQGSSSSTTDDDDSGSTYSSSYTRSSPRWDSHSAVLGEISEQHSTQTRGRSGSMSSTASRPAPAKSILSCSSSVKTKKGRSPPSVKFVDRPTVHYEEDESAIGYDAEYDEEPTWPRSPMPASPDVTGKKRVFGWLSWLSTSVTASPKRAKASPILPERPLISGPMPLWETPRHAGTFPRRNTTSSSGRSIRSVKSVSSLRSVRSCASRLQVYWGRMGAKDP